MLPAELKREFDKVLDQANVDRMNEAFYRRILAQLVLTHGKVNPIGEVALEVDISRANEAFAVEPWQLLIGSGGVTITYHHPLKEKK